MCLELHCPAVLGALEIARKVLATRIIVRWPLTAQLGMDVGLRWEPNQQIGEQPDGDRSWGCFDWPLLGTLRSLRRVINRGCGLRWKRCPGAARVNQGGFGVKQGSLRAQFSE